MPVLGVSVLGEKLAGSVRQLAGPDIAARLEDVETTAASSGAVFLDDATIRLECVTENVHSAGDHDIVVLRVTALRTDLEKRPLIWHQSGFATLTSPQLD